MISIGIDVSKGKSTVCFLKPGGEVLKTPFEVPHTKNELNELADKIISYGEEARVVLENTGYYHWQVVKALVERGIFVTAVNPLFEYISSMGEARFVRDFCKWSQKQGYRVDHERQAKMVFALVQNGIPVLPNTPTTKIVVLEALRRVHELENSRDIILAQMNELGKTLPEYSLISEMKCIGEGLTPRIIAEIGDVRRFHSKHALIAYAYRCSSLPFPSAIYILPHVVLEMLLIVPTTIYSVFQFSPVSPSLQISINSGIPIKVYCLRRSG